jgi:hypothetical protein
VVLQRSVAGWLPTRMNSAGATPEV